MITDTFSFINTHTYAYKNGKDYENIQLKSSERCKKLFIVMS